MRQENLQTQITLKVPFECPDGNGVVYSKQAVEKAISALKGNLPILYRDNEVCQEGKVIGYAAGNTASILWDDDCKVCEVILDAAIHYGGTECIVKSINNGVVADFEITALGISK